MLYSYIVKKSIRQSFDHVNNHRWDEAVKAVAPHVHHRVSGAHALVVSATTKKPCAAGLSASAASCPLSISRSTTSG
jgi:hypothetical protein